MPEKHYQSIFLSPHLDDAVLSCGGRIFQERQGGQSVLVFTVMAGDAPPASLDAPFVAALHARWELDAVPNAVAVRRAEERAALTVLGVDGAHGPWPDCIYRRHPATGAFLYHSESALFGPILPVEAELASRVAQRLADLPLADGGRVYVPLTAGGHVDHRIVRQAAEAWGAPQGELVYYEDYPYAEQRAQVEMLTERGWRSELFPLTETSLQAKIIAVLCYRSQISTFFKDQDETRRRLSAFAQVGGNAGWSERYWRRN